MTKYPRVIIVTLNWNGVNLTLKCLDSLKELTYPNYQVIAIDNASDGDDFQIIKETHGDWISTIKNETNLGFAEGSDRGIEEALRNEADYVLLLNNDTVVDRDFLDRMVAIGELYADIGILSPTIYDHDHPNKVQYQGHSIGWYGNPARRIRIHDPFPDFKEVEAVIGICFLIKRELIQKIGLLDPIYFYQEEDIDYCVRAKRAGFRIVCVPDAQVWHHGSASLNKVPARKVGYFLRNRIIFFSKYASKVQLLIFLLQLFFFEIPINVFYYQFKYPKASILKKVIWGVHDGFVYFLSERKAKR